MMQTGIRLFDRPRRDGFTLVEMLIVVVVAAVLLSAAVPQFGKLQARWGADNARDAYMSLAARARATAVQQGVTVWLTLDTDADEAVVYTAAPDTIETQDFAADLFAEVTASVSGPIELCYTPRGFAHPACTNVTAPVTVTFSRGAYDSQAEVKPLGQVEQL